MGQSRAGQSAAWRVAEASAETARRVLSWFTGALAAGAMAVLVFQAATGVEGATEALLVLLILLGTLLVVAVRRNQPQVTVTDRTVAAGSAAAIDALDRVEHRRLELGRPWPQLVVGPTGVSIIEMCPGLGPAHPTPAGVPTASRDGCARCGAARVVAQRARQLLAGIEGGHDVPVRVLAVVPPNAQACGGGTGPAGAFGVVPADRLPDTLARGPVLPMALVERSFTRLASLAGALVDR